MGSLKGPRVVLGRGVPGEGSFGVPEGEGPCDDPWGIFEGSLGVLGGSLRVPEVVVGGGGDSNFNLKFQTFLSKLSSALYNEKSEDPSIFTNFYY